MEPKFEDHLHSKSLRTKYNSFLYENKLKLLEKMFNINICLYLDAYKNSTKLNI